MHANAAVPVPAPGPDTTFPSPGTVSVCAPLTSSPCVQYAFALQLEHLCFLALLLSSSAGAELTAVNQPHITKQAVLTLACAQPQTPAQPAELACLAPVPATSRWLVVLSQRPRYGPPALDMLDPHCTLGVLGAQHAPFLSAMHSMARSDHAGRHI